MKALHKARLLKLAKFLDKLPREKFDFSTITTLGKKSMPEALKAGKHFCGTVGCAIGWMPACFPRDVMWEPHEGGREYLSPDVILRRDPVFRDFGAAEYYFGLSYEEARYVFVPLGHGNSLSDTATPKQVAKHIRDFVKRQTRLPALERALRNAERTVAKLQEERDELAPWEHGDL